MNPIRRKISRSFIATLGILAICHPFSVQGKEPGTTAIGNLLTNPSFEQEATVTDESSLPGWQLSFRQNPNQPLLTQDEAALIDDPQQSHSGRRFLRIRPRNREISLQSPKTAGFEPGLYEVSAWVRGRPGTKAAFGLYSLGATFGAGIWAGGGQWQKFSTVVYSKGVAGHIPFLEQTQLSLTVFPPGQREQVADPMLEIDDVSIARLNSGLADAFSDHMVVQRDRPVPIWGWAKDPGQSVSIAFNGQTKTAVADKDGRWQAILAPMKAGGPFVVELDGRPTAYDVMIGDVWICSGQSNMEFGIDKLNGIFNHAPQAIAQANQPQIRLWQAPKQFSPTPMRSYLTRQSVDPDDFQATWETCSPRTVSHGAWGGFSAIGYFFGREIQADQKVTIGLMMIANGGTEIESFISEEGLRAVPKDQWVVPPIARAAMANLHNTPFPKLPEGVVAPSAAYGEIVAGHIAFNSRQGEPDINRAFHYATAAYNGLMAPVFPYAVRGVLWYQGEHNGNDSHYEPKLKALIADWRARFGQKDLPFVIAQLAYWSTKDPARWQLVREAQLHVSQTVPNTALTVTFDLANREEEGGLYEIHPKRKLEVGQRMAMAARAVAYDEKIVSSGPIYREMKPGEGRISLGFDSVGGGLEAHGEKLVGFQIAGSDMKFVDAVAVIADTAVVVSSPTVPMPVAVRYGFAQFMLPLPNLYNKEGLPASPFRTDDWPVK